MPSPRLSRNSLSLTEVMPHSALMPVAAVVGEGDAVDADVAGAVAQEQAGAAIVLEAAAEPAQCARLPAAGAVAEVGAALVRCRSSSELETRPSKTLPCTSRP